MRGRKREREGRGREREVTLEGSTRLINKRRVVRGYGAWCIVLYGGRLYGVCMVYAVYVRCMDRVEGERKKGWGKKSFVNINGLLE